MAVPLIVSTSPVSDANGVVLSDTLRITFDRMVDEQSIINGGIFVEGPETDRWSGPDQAYWEDPNKTTDDEILESPGYDGIVPGTFSFIKVSGEALAEIATITLPNLIGATDGDYVVIYDVAGDGWAIALDTTGAAAQTPTGAVWVSVDAGKKVYLDVSAATTAEEIVVLVVAALNALTGFDLQMTLTDNEDGTFSTLQGNVGVCTDPEVHDFDDSGAGSIAATVDTAGQAEVFETDRDNETTWTTTAVFTPVIPWAAGTEYRVWIVGDADADDVIGGGVGTRTIFDTDSSGSASDGEVFFTGTYTGTTNDVINVRIEEAGNASDEIEVTWWKDSDPLDIHQLWTKEGSQLMVDGIRIRFYGDFLLNDDFTVEVKPIQLKLLTETFVFSTGSGSILSIPSPALDTSTTIDTFASVAGRFRVLDITPKERATNLDPEETSDIVVTFSADVDPTTVTDSTVKIWAEPVNGDPEIPSPGELTAVLTVVDDVLTITIG